MGSEMCIRDRMISVPAFVVATAATCLCVYWKGCELEDDPEFKRRVAAGEFQELVIKRDDSKLEIPASGATPC